MHGGNVRDIENLSTVPALFFLLSKLIKLAQKFLLQLLDLLVKLDLCHLGCVALHNCGDLIIIMQIQNNLRLITIVPVHSPGYIN